MNVSLRDVVLAVRYGDAALAGESAGYLILGAADACLGEPQFASVDAITLTPEGGLRLDGFACGADDAEDSLRVLLGQLLGNVRSSAPNLQRISERPERRGLRGLIQELEAALIPVNRRAAARTLARLVREAERSAAQERAFAEVEEVPLAYTASEGPLCLETESLSPPAGTMAPVSGQAVEGRGDELDASGSARAPDQSPWPTSSQLPALELSPAHGLSPTWPKNAVREAAPPLAPERFIDTSQVVVSTMEIPHRRTAHPHNGSRPVIVPAAIVHAFSAESSFDDAHESGELYYEEPDVFFEDDDLDELPTQAFEGTLGPRAPILFDAPLDDHSAPECFDEPAAIAAIAAVAAVAAIAATPAIQHSASLFKLDDSIALPRRRIVAPLPVPKNEAKTQLARRVPPKLRYLHAVRRAKRPLRSGESLVPLDKKAPIRRPSEIDELLNRMRVHEQSQDDVCIRLKNLARLEFSPLLPPTAERAAS
jgi:hypothetical protein